MSALSDKMKMMWEAAGKEQPFAKPIMKHLWERCKEDPGLGEDILLEHKSWERLHKYLYGKAKEQAVNGCAAVMDSVVYEWAEDYFRMDDKEQVEKEIREEEERKKKAEEDKKKREEEAKKRKEKAEKKAAKEAAKAAEESADPAPAEDEEPEDQEPEPVPEDKSQVEGQMSLFDMVGQS